MRFPLINKGSELSKFGKHRDKKTKARQVYLLGPWRREPQQCSISLNQAAGGTLSCVCKPADARFLSDRLRAFVRGQVGARIVRLPGCTVPLRGKGMASGVGRPRGGQGVRGERGAAGADPA